MLFERLLVYDDRAFADAATNMAIDEALLELSEQPALRFYGWARASISFGYFGKYEEIAAINDGCDLVRRWTGGGAVPHGDDLTYSLVTPATHPAFRLGPLSVYAALHSAIRDGLRDLGFAVELAQSAAPKISNACFSNPVRDDLMMGNRKVAGAAQRRTRAGFLQQGSIQISHLPEDFRERFARALSVKVEQREIPVSVLTRAAQLTSEKYRTAAWLRRC